MISAGKKRVAILMTEERYADLDQLCRDLGISKSSACGLALSEWLPKMKADLDARQKLLSK